MVRALVISNNSAPESAPIDLQNYAMAVVQAVLERLCVPFLLLKSTGQVSFSSVMLADILDDGRHLSIGPDLRLIVNTPDGRKTLQDCLAGLDNAPFDVSVTLLADDDSMPLYATLSAFTPPAPAGFPPLGAFLALFIREAEDDEGLVQAQARFGLTGAERDVLDSIVGGLTIAQHAVRRGVSVHTARKQLNILMQKMGVSRQFQLSSVVDALSGRDRGPAMRSEIARRLSAAE